MNFTTEPPTTPGHFVIQHKQSKCRSLAEVYKSYVGLAVCFGGAARELNEWFNDYEWCRLVPAEEVDSLRKRNEKLTAAIKKFVHRCEIGEVRSRKTYAEFCQLLESAEEKL